VPGVTASIKIITSLASERIARFAFEYSRRRNRRKVTAVHKANIMKLTDGLFLDSARKVAAEYPDIEFEDQIVDALCMKLVMDPHRFDVLLLSNLYGDIVSDLAAGLVGGLGVVPGANYGDEYAVFEAVHGSAPDIAGKGIANPLAVLFSGIMMLRRLGRDDIADRIKKAAFSVLQKGTVRTPDLGGRATTEQFADAIIAELG
jgi:isocitrate dehydrogenase (NAD+)